MARPVLRSQVESTRGFVRYSSQIFRSFRAVFFSYNQKILSVSIKFKKGVRKIPHSPSDDEIILEAEDIMQAFLDQLDEDLTFFESKISGASTLEKSDADELLRKMHSDKGAASALGYTILTQLLHQMEELIIRSQKGKAFQEEILLSKVDYQRKVIELSRDNSIDRVQYIAEYEKLRVGLFRR